MMDESQAYAQLLKNAEVLGSLVAKVDGIQEDIKAMQPYEKRIGLVESDVRTFKRIVGSLFTFLLVAGAATANWLKG